MTREEIKEFLEIELNYFETDREEDWYKVGLVDGLKIADENPNLEKFWHSVHEKKPERGSYFIAEDYEGHLDAFCWTEKDVDWIDYYLLFKLKRWAYMKDFLPKINNFIRFEDYIDLKESTKIESFKLKQSSNYPRYRMFKSSEECWQEMFKHKPFGWIKTKNKSSNFLLIDNLSDEGYLSKKCTFPFSFKTLFENYTFADGTPFGIKED